MPQMMPINWMLSFFFFICIFLMFNMMNYFIFYLKTKNKNINIYKNNNNNNKILIWKW